VCGLFDTTRCCDTNQTLISLNGGAENFCTTADGSCKTLLYQKGQKTKQSDYNNGECASCGIYPQDKCAVCADGQQLSRDGNYCVNTTTHACYTPLSWSNGQSSQTSYANDATCPCGLEAEYCPTCDDGQTQQGDYCVDTQTSVCYEHLSYNNGKKQAQATDPSCSVCGLFDTTRCCDTNQTLISLNGGAENFCTTADGSCKTLLYQKGQKTKQSDYSQGACKTCGAYPEADCIYCYNGQDLVVGDTPYCVVKSTKQCLSALEKGKSQQQIAYYSDEKHCCHSGYYGGNSQDKRQCPTLS
jgi:hypothetical protein